MKRRRKLNAQFQNLKQSLLSPKLISFIFYNSNINIIIIYFSELQWRIFPTLAYLSD